MMVRLENASRIGDSGGLVVVVVVIIVVVITFASTTRTLLGMGTCITTTPASR